MEIVNEVYVAQHKNGLYFGEGGYGTLTYKILYAMLCESKEQMESHLRLAEKSLKDFEIHKLFICKPITEEIS